VSDHPYLSAPANAFWKRSVSGTSPGDIDPVVGDHRIISKSSKVISAGSCFAAHIARYLTAYGYDYLITEDLHEAFRVAHAAHCRKIGYGAYSAHYGNIYTARQLLQLLLRSYDMFQPQDHVWIEGGAFVDPFRPTLPDPASTIQEYHALRVQHFAAVRRAFEEAEVFIFTFGLTEAWRSKCDGAVYPVCPGAAAGTFDAEVHEFVNFSIDETYNDFAEAVTLIRRVNPAIQIVVTVSPVPLVATASGGHVLTSTIYSKSVLRIAAEWARERLGCIYFPAYEIITGPQAPFDYFEADRRNVSEVGVAHVMRLFFKHLTFEDFLDDAAAPARARPASLSPSAAIAEAACEEELLELTMR
jgi:hypothetical protein